jgi:hypothetical protein
MPKTNGLLLVRAGAFLTVAAGLMTLVTAATSQVADAPRPMTVTGCLVTERVYAIARGLGRPAASNDAQLVLVVEKGAVPGATLDGLALTGRQEAALAADADRRITLEGTLEPPLTASPGIATRTPDDSSPAPSGAVGTTPLGSPAHEPSDALVLEARTEDGARASDGAVRTRPASLADLSRLDVTSARDPGERCQLAVASQSPATSAPNAAAPVASAPRSSAPDASARGDAGTPITVIGCLVREEAADGSGMYLAVVGTVAGAGESRVQGSAVPGSLPSGTGSGTIGTTGTSNIQPSAFRLVTTDPSVAQRVGQRVEVVGTAERADVSGSNVSNATTAHTSVPTRQIRVTSVRAASGSCR